MAQLIDELFHRHLGNPLLTGDDFASLGLLAGHRLVVSTDSHVISPLFFPGGDIGSLAVHGTVNDVAVSGAQPRHLTAGFILEEGFPLADLDRLVASMAAAAANCGVCIVAGDTKVVERGKGDGVFITTTGFGLVPERVAISGCRAQPGDAILINGSIGDHGVAVLAHREHLEFETDLVSDSAPLNGLIAAMLEAVPEGAVHALRDPTRGGLATTLNELAEQSNVGMQLDEAAIPIKPGVAAACELLGLDPLYVANEGKLVCVCAADAAEPLLECMRAHPLGREARRIGHVTDDPSGFVQMRTSLGGQRIVDWLAGEQLPRIC